MVSFQGYTNWCMASRTQYSVLDNLPGFIEKWDFSSIWFSIRDVGRWCHRCINHTPSLNSLSALVTYRIRDSSNRTTHIYVLGRCWTTMPGLLPFHPTCWPSSVIEWLFIIQNIGRYRDLIQFTFPMSLSLFRVRLHFAIELVKWTKEVALSHAAVVSVMMAKMNRWYSSHCCDTMATFRLTFCES